MCDADDLCPGGDDSFDSDFDTVPDDCDVCEGDDLGNRDADGTPDDCDDSECAIGCAEGVVAQEAFGLGIFDCAGSVAWEDARSLCARRWVLANAELWVAAQGRAVPTYNYWTSDELAWETDDGAGDCSVDLIGDGTHSGGCGDGPMWVCAASEDDFFGRNVANPLGNTCTWVGCGFRDNAPNQFFGGCRSHPEGGPEGGLAGSLCFLLE